MSLTYNGISLGYVATQNVAHEAVRDPSNLDQIYTRVTFRVRAIIATDVPPAMGAELPAAAFARVRHELMRPRRRLVYTAPDGTTLLDVGGDAGEFADSASGPTPLSCDLEGVYQGSIVVNYAVEANVIDCPAAANKLYTSLKWSETSDYDPDWYLTKTRSGQLVVSRADAISPDALRGLVTPDVPAGFRRDKASYILDEAGLVLRFVFVDRELFRAPLFPATRMQGMMRETVPLPGAVRRGEVSLKLTGPKWASPMELMRAAVIAAYGRALQAGVITTNGRVLMGGAIEESLNDTECSVQVSFQWMMKPTIDNSRSEGPNPAAGAVTGGMIGGAIGGIFGLLPGVIAGTIGAGVGAIDSVRGGMAPRPNAQGRDQAGIPMFAGWVGTDLAGSDPSRAVGPPLFGTAFRVRMAAAALNDPCGQDVQLPDQPEAGAVAELVGTTTSGAELRATVNPFAALAGDDQAALYNNVNDGPGVYDHYIIAAKYSDDAGVTVLASTKDDEPAAKVRLHAGLLKLEVAWTAARVGGTPVIPNPEPSDPNWVLVGKSDLEADHIDLAADGVTCRVEVRGVYRYVALDRCKANILAPIPPFLAYTVAPEARKVAALLGTDVVFDASADGSNPFCGRNVELVSRTSIAEMRGGPPVNP